MELLTDDALEASSVVANVAMNRERRLAGRDGYSRVLGFDILSLPPGARWLDLCCGSGRALLDAAAARPDLDITGVDLVGYFAAAGPVRFETASITAWEPAAPVRPRDLRARAALRRRQARARCCARRPG